MPYPFTHTYTYNGCTLKNILMCLDHIYQFESNSQGISSIINVRVTFFKRCRFKLAVIVLMKIDLEVSCT